ncbi:hypothetical protein N824_10485 [Pedobacter sp. V48]|nr:hypothetical protein N824_10485 [Pedobacter sp. V48]
MCKKKSNLKTTKWLKTSFQFTSGKDEPYIAVSYYVLWAQF